MIERTLVAQSEAQAWRQPAQGSSAPPLDPEGSQDLARDGLDEGITVVAGVSHRSFPPGAPV